MKKKRNENLYIENKNTRTKRAWNFFQSCLNVKECIQTVSKPLSVFHRNIDVILKCCIIASNLFYWSSMLNFILWGPFVETLNHLFCTPTYAMWFLSDWEKKIVHFTFVKQEHDIMYDLNDKFVFDYLKSVE